MTRPFARTFAMAAITLAVSTLLCLAGLEIVVRTFFPQPLGVSRRSEMSLPVHTPNYTMHRKTDEFEMTTTFNSLGLRDGEVEIPKPDGVFRILVLGDSITAALEVADREVYTEILEAELNRYEPERRFEVVNAAVSGFGQGDQLRMLEHLGDRIEPDWVLVQMSPINDLSENLFCRWYTIEDGEIQSLADIPPGIAVRLEEWLGRRFHLAQWARVRIHRTVGERAERLERIESHKRRYHDLLYGAGGDREGFREDWETTFLYLAALQAKSSELGADFAVTIRPLDRDVVGSRGDPYPVELIVEFCEERQIPCLDLTPVFRSRADGDLLSFRFEKDSHWTPEGHRWAAEACLDFFVRLGIATERTDSAQADP